MLINAAQLLMFLCPYRETLFKPVISFNLKYCCATISNSRKKTYCFVGWIKTVTANVTCEVLIIPETVVQRCSAKKDVLIKTSQTLWENTCAGVSF